MQKMKIRLLANDSKYPNIAIMKLSRYHKERGDNVAWYNPIADMSDTDIFYHSKIFNFSEPYMYYPTKAKIYKGGTGFDVKKKLPQEIDNITNVDYSIYPECDYSLQFLSRGCVRNCDFCLVRQKEGFIHQVKPMELNPQGKYIKLLDNNFFACKEWRENIEILKSYNQPIDFNQGIDIRSLTEEQAKSLSSIKIKNIHCAWDNYQDKKEVLKGLDLLTKYIKPYKITVYVLVGFKTKQVTVEDIERIETLRKYEVKPFAMAYRDLNEPTYEVSREIKKFCRYVNRKEIFNAVKWEEYR